MWTSHQSPFPVPGWCLFSVFSASPSGPLLPSISQKQTTSSSPSELFVPVTPSTLLPVEP